VLVIMQMIRASLLSSSLSGDYSLVYLLRLCVSMFALMSAALATTLVAHKRRRQQNSMTYNLTFEDACGR
jgi:phosphotransferase system  glucose/maltose/N-acetylglucosamine-specific IIC component